jgi:hypothetical protein
MKAKEIADSLQKIGIDTLLIYRNWYGMNGFNGNGKVLWEQHGTLHQYYISFKNDINDYGIKSIVHSTMPDKVFIYYFDHKIDTVQSNPTAKREGPDHDSNYYVYVRITKAIYCFNVNGQAVKDDSLHPRSQLIFRLLVNTKNNYR